MILEFGGEAVSWRGPAPFVFVPVPPDVAEVLRTIAAQVTYGWGVIPAIVTIGETTYKTSLFPRDGGYLVPVKAVVQRAESVGVGDFVPMQLEIVGSR